MEELSVLVVGAGPVGLALAVVLEHHGVRFRIVDQAETASTVSKAAGIQSRTLEILDELGLADAFLELGTRTTASELWFDGRPVATFGSGGVAMASRYPFLLGLPQPATEALLTRRLAQRDISVERGVELGECRQDERGVTATLRRPDGSTEGVRCHWLAGCDGARSRVRDVLRFPTKDDPRRTSYAIADCAMTWPEPAPVARLVLDDRAVLVHPVGPDRWRLAVDCGPAPVHGRPAPPTAADLQRLCDAHLPVPARVESVDWSTSYCIGADAATRWRARRVFLLGDAARVHSPLTFLGMNSGIQDAWNLGWKLAMAERGLATDLLLDSFDAERRDVDARMVHGATVLDHVVGGDDPGATTRELALGFAASLPGYERHTALQTARHDFAYRSSPAVGGHHRAGDGAAVDRHPTHGVHPGDLAPDAPFTTDSGVRVRDGRSYVSLHFTGEVDPDGSTGVADLPLPGRVPIRTVLVTRAPGLRAARSGTSIVTDSGGGIHQAWGITRPTHVLVRPDGAVGWRAEPPDARAVTQFLARLHGAVAPERPWTNEANRQERLAG